MRSRWRRALGSWLLGGVLAGFAVLPICDLHFDCGCDWPGLGGYAHCDIHTAGPPDCPWCDRWLVGLIGMGSGYVIGLAVAVGLPLRLHFALNALVVVFAILAGLLLSGMATSLALGLPLLAGL